MFGKLTAELAVLTYKNMLKLKLFRNGSYQN